MSAENPVSARVAASIATLRRSHRITAQDLSDRTYRLGYPVSRATISKIETGERIAINLDELDVIARALSVRPEDLLTQDAARLALKARAQALRAEADALEREAEGGVS